MMTRCFSRFGADLSFSFQVVLFFDLYFFATVFGRPKLRRQDPRSHPLSALAAAEGLLLKGLVPETNDSPAATRNPWAWVPTLYFAEGIPYILVTGVSIALYKDMGISNADITFYTTWTALPWTLKPLWSPVVDILKTRRLWIWIMQLVFGAGFAAVALTLPGANFFRWSLAVFFLIAFSSATHDIAADGFYMLANTEGQQSFFSGVRNTFYRVAMICAQGLLLILAGKIQKQTGNVAQSWQIAFWAATGVVVLLGAYHMLVLPWPAADRPGEGGSIKKFLGEFFGTFGEFFKKPKIGRLILFLLFYRFGEVQLAKIVQPFLKDPHLKGGLGLATDELGLVYGTIGVAALLVGGVAGGVLVSRRGLKAWLWPMVLVMHIPDAVFIYLSQVQPHSLFVISGCVALEQFGYGFGLTAFTLYMIYISRGPHATAHYAICTGFMSLGRDLPGMWSGHLQEWVGYQHFFIWVMLATIPGFIVTALIPLDGEFGKKA
jgi:PAT family beta-lactamase induction signal transducer AmpG